MLCITLIVHYNFLVAHSSTAIVFIIMLVVASRLVVGRPCISGVMFHDFTPNPSHASEVFLLLLKLPNLLFKPSPMRRPVVLLLRISPSKSEYLNALPLGFPALTDSTWLPLALLCLFIGARGCISYELLPSEGTRR